LSGDEVPLFKAQQQANSHLKASTNKGLVQRKVFAKPKRKIKKICEQRTGGEFKSVSYVASRKRLQL